MDNSSPTPPSPVTMGLSMATQAITGHRKQALRLRDLAMKMHQCGSIVLPIPNIVALQLLTELQQPDEIAYVAEAVFILRNQTNEDILFLKGDERRRVIAACVKDIPASHLLDYIFALQDLLLMLEKKSANSAMSLTQTMNDLIRQARSYSSPKPTDNPQASSSAN